MEAEGIAYEPCESIGTVVYLARDGSVCRNYSYL